MQDKLELVDFHLTKVKEAVRQLQKVRRVKEMTQRYGEASVSAAARSSVQIPADVVLSSVGEWVRRCVDTLHTEFEGLQSAVSKLGLSLPVGDLFVREE